MNVAVMPDAPSDGPAAVRVAPAPTEEEAAAICAAVQALWPRPSTVAPMEPRRTAWRFSGRWWNGPVALRRSRPRF